MRVTSAGYTRNAVRARVRRDAFPPAGAIITRQFDGHLSDFDWETNKRSIGDFEKN